jgi:hypothetical protein
MITCGWIVHYLHFDRHWAFVRSYRAIFFGYAACGILKLLFVLFMSSKVESEAFLARKRTRNAQSSGETAPLLDGVEGAAGEHGHVNGTLGANGQTSAAASNEPVQGSRTSMSRLSSLVPNISRESVGVVISLCFLFGLDAFASSLASL